MKIRNQGFIHEGTKRVRYHRNELIVSLVVEEEFLLLRLTRIWNTNVNSSEFTIRVEFDYTTRAGKRTQEDGYRIRTLQYTSGHVQQTERIPPWHMAQYYDRECSIWILQESGEDNGGVDVSWMKQPIEIAL